MTPITNTETDEEERYNEIHIRTRLIVERAFGTWKRRFPCLARGLTTKLLCSTSIVVACAVLHNMSLIFNDVLPEEDEVFTFTKKWMYQMNIICMSLMDSLLVKH